MTKQVIGVKIGPAFWQVSRDQLVRITAELVEQSDGEPGFLQVLVLNDSDEIREGIGNGERI